jgi:hypothetical protein
VKCPGLHEWLPYSRLVRPLKEKKQLTIFILLVTSLFFTTILL